MGSPETEGHRYPDEIQRRVTLTRPFAMWKYEVTQGEFKALMGYNPSLSISCGDDCPVERVTWHEAAVFCNALSNVNGLRSCFECKGTGTSVKCEVKSIYKGNEGKDYYKCSGYRLPTEAEWEYAYRAGTTSAFYGELDKIAWSRQNSGGKPHPVGQKQPNAWGLFDMAGNVAEWTFDRPKSYTSSSETEPIGAYPGQFRLLRGGSWDVDGGYCRAALRLKQPPDYRDNNLGLRPSRCIPYCGDKECGDDGCDGTCSPGCPFEKLCQKGRCGNLALQPQEVKIPAGTFTMGSPVTEKDRFDDENQRQITLTMSFAMWKYEVTQKEFKALMGYNPSLFVSCGDDCPVEHVTWHEAAAFCNALSKKHGLRSCFECKGTGTSVKCEVKSTYKGNEGKDYYKCSGYRLPTEAEWEYAYRAGTTSAFYGDLDRIAWYKQNSGGKLHPVGQKQPNAWGLFDMAGNASEWTIDRWSHFSSGVVSDPFGDSPGGLRVFRGGGWDSSEEYCRAAYREFTPDLDFHGFRPSRSLP